MLLVPAALLLQWPLARVVPVLLVPAALLLHWPLAHVVPVLLVPAALAYAWLLAVASDIPFPFLFAALLLPLAAVFLSLVSFLLQLSAQALATPWTAGRCCLRFLGEPSGTGMAFITRSR